MIPTMMLFALLPMCANAAQMEANKQSDQNSDSAQQNSESNDKVLNDLNEQIKEEPDLYDLNQQIKEMPYHLRSYILPYTKHKSCYSVACWTETHRDNKVTISITLQEKPFEYCDAIKTPYFETILQAGSKDTIKIVDADLNDVSRMSGTYHMRHRYKDWMQFEQDENGYLIEPIILIQP